MSGYDLNELVEMGKDDVLQFMKKNLFSEVSREGQSGPVLTSYFLAVKKEHAELDLVRTRTLILQENEAFLSGVDSANPYLVYAMARAAGRISQMEECLKAVERMRITHDGDSAETLAAIETLGSFLSILEKSCVRLMRLPEGRFGLSPMGEGTGAGQEQGHYCA